MELLILVVVLSLVAIFSVLLDRRWQQRAVQRQSAQSPVHTSSLSVSDELNNSLLKQIRESWHKRMGWHTEPTVEEPKLRNWLINNLAEQSEVQHWVSELTDQEFNALHRQLQAFCGSLQIDLSWLGEQPLAQDQRLRDSVESVVLHYMEAQHHAAIIQSELEAFKTYQMLEQRPYSYEHQPLLQQLYIQVVQSGLAKPARPEALLATEKIRVEHMLRAIQSAAEADRPAFYRIVNAVRNPMPQDVKIPPRSPDSMHNGQPATAS